MLKQKPTFSHTNLIVVESFTRCLIKMYKIGFRAFKSFFCIYINVWLELAYSLVIYQKIKISTF